MPAGDGPVSASVMVSPTLTGTFTGQVYTTPATVVTAITCATACTQTSITTTVQWNVTFNRSVANVDASIAKPSMVLAMEHKPGEHGSLIKVRADFNDIASWEASQQK